MTTGVQKRHLMPDVSLGRVLPYTEQSAIFQLLRWLETRKLAQKKSVSWSTQPKNQRFKIFYPQGNTVQQNQSNFPCREFDI